MSSSKSKQLSAVFLLFALMLAAWPLAARAEGPAASQGWGSQSFKPATEDLLTRFPQLKGLSRFKPGDPHLVVAQSLLAVKEGAMTPEQFYRRLGELRDAQGKLLSMRDVISVKTEIQKAGGQNLLDNFLGEHYAEGGSAVEKKLLVARRKLTLDALDHVYKKFSSHPLADGSRVFLAPVGKWATQEDKALTFSGDIDASLVSGNAELIRLMRDEFAGYLKKRTGLSMTQIDSIITAHGQATGDVYVGEHGKKYGDQAIAGVTVQEIDLKRGVLKPDEVSGRDALAASQLETQIRAHDKGWDPDKVIRTDIKGEPGFSMEMARHLEHDIIKGGIFSSVDSIVKTCKYLDRSNKYFTAETGMPPAAGRLADLASLVTKTAKYATAADIHDLIVAYTGGSGLDWEVDLVPGPDGVVKAALKANQRFVDGFFADARASIWSNVRRGLEFRLNALKAQTSELKKKQGADDEAGKQEREKVLTEVEDIQKMLLDEIKVFGPDEFKRQAPADVRILIDDYIRLSEGLKDSLGAKAFTLEQQKQFDLLKSLLQDNPDANRLAMAAAVAMDLASKTVDDVNARLDWLDDTIMGPLRGDPSFDQWMAEVKKTQAAARAAGQPGQAAKGIRQAAKAGMAQVEVKLNNFLYQNTFAKKARDINVWANQKIQATSAGRAAMKGLTAFNLATEIKAYSDALASDGMSGLAAEFIRRRVPLGSAAENLYMGNYLAATWDVFVTVFPPAGLVQAAYSFGNYAFSLGWGAYWSESLGVFVDGLYAGAKWEAAGTVKYKDAEVVKYKLISVTFKDATLQRDDLEKDLAPLDRWFSVEMTLRQNLMDTDPALVLLAEMQKHPAVGEKLEAHFKHQYWERWREVKLNFIKRMFAELEERKNSEEAREEGQLPKMYKELMDLAGQLEVAERMAQAMDREWASNNLQLVAQYLHDLKRAIAGQAPTESEENRAATIVTHYLDFYRPYADKRKALEDYLAGLYEKAGLLPAPNPVQHRLRLLTGMPFLTCNPAQDRQKTKELVEAVLGVEPKDRERLIKLKEAAKAGSALDNEFDRRILAQLVFNGVWVRAIDQAMVPVISKAGYERAKGEHLEARNKLFREFSAHYKAAPALLVRVRQGRDGAAADKPVAGATVWLTGPSGQKIHLEPRDEGDFAALDLAAGRYTAWAKAPGHVSPEGVETARKDVDIPAPSQGKEPAPTSVTLVLRPSLVSATRTEVVDMRDAGDGKWALTLRVLDDKQADAALGSLKAETSVGQVKGGDGSPAQGPWPLKGGPLTLIWEPLPGQEGLSGSAMFTYLGDASGPAKENQRYQPSQAYLVVPPGRNSTMWVRPVDDKDPKQPVADARIELRGKSKHNSRVRMEQVGSPAGFTPLPPGDYEITAQAPSHAKVQKIVTLAGDGPFGGQDVVLPMEPLPVVGITVTVTNARQADQLVANAQVTLSARTNGGLVLLSGSGSGRVVFASVPPGSYQVHAAAPGFAEATGSFYVSPNPKDAKAQEVRLRLEPLHDMEERRGAVISIDCPDKVMGTDIFTATAKLPPKAAAAAKTFIWSGAHLIDPKDPTKRYSGEKTTAPTAQLQFRQREARGSANYGFIASVHVRVQDAQGKEIARGVKRVQLDPAQFGTQSSWRGGAGDWGVHLEKKAENIFIHGKNRYTAHANGTLSVKWCDGSCRQSIESLTKEAAKHKDARLEKFSLNGFEGVLLVRPPRYRYGGSQWVDVVWPKGGGSVSGVAYKGQEGLEIAGSVYGNGIGLGVKVLWHDDMPFIQAQGNAMFAEMMGMVGGLTIQPKAGLTYTPPKGPAWNGTDMPKVVLTASNATPKIGDTVEFTATVEKLPSGETPLVHTWTGAAAPGDGKGASASLTVTKDGKLTVGVSVQGAQTYLGAASQTIEVKKAQAELRLVSPVQPRLAVGGAASFALTMSGAPPGAVYRWQPINEVRWQKTETSVPNNQGQALKPGKLKVWVEVLAKDGGGLKTIATSNQLELEVVKPKLSLKATPVPPQPVMIGQPVRVRLEADPAPPELDVRWLPLSSDARQTGQSSDGREITFLPLSEKAFEVKALARVPGGGEDLGEASLKVQARAYKAEVTVVGRPFEPQFPVWTKSKGLVKVDKGFKVGQQVAVKAAVPGHPDQASLRYQWKVGEGCTAGGTISQTVNVSRSELGSCPCQVEVSDRSGAVVARGEGSFQVSLSNEMIDKGRQMAQQGQKPAEETPPELALARKLWQEGGADDAVALLQKANKAQPGQAVLAALLDDYRGRLARLRGHLDRGRALLERGDLAGARRQVSQGAELCRNYPPLAVLAADVGQRAAQQKQKEDEAKKLVKQGSGLEKQGDMAGALAAFQKAYKLVPNEPLAARIAALKARMETEARSAKQAKELVREGVALEKAGRIQEALVKFRQAYKLAPNPVLAERIARLQK